MKKSFLLVLIFLSSMPIYSQEKSIALTGTNTFTSNESYLISNPYGAIYDNSGWLWILGENELSNKYIFGEKEIIIQRFDGSNFFTLKIPETPSKKIREGHFFKHKEKGLYMKLYYRVARAELFFINTETLEIQAVDAYNNLDEKYIISKEYQVADHNRLMITSKDKFYSAELDKSSLKMIDSVAFDQSVANPFIAEIKTTVDYSIVKLLFEKDGCLVGKDGKIIKKIKESDFVNLEGTHFFPEVIHNVIKIKGEFYHYIDDYPNAFSYDQQIKKFIEIPNTSDNYKINRLLEFKNNDNFAVESDLVSDYSEIKLYKFNDFKTELIGQVKVKNFSKIIYKRFGEDLVVLNGNTLRCYTFKENKIKTFLKDKSIRTIKKMGENTYMVATDNEGFYIIDVKNNTEQKVTFMDNDVPLSINYSRDILNGKNNTIITGGSNFLYTIDANYKVIKEETVKTGGEEIIRIKDSIFTSDQGGGISKYSINEKTYLEIENTGEIQVREFATDGNTLYATSSQGIFEYKNGTFTTYEFKNVSADNLLSINYLEGFGVLVSTKFGEIYKFDTSTKKLNLFYEDELNASIVGMVADNHNNLWLNTYAGIVSLNPSTKKMLRYTTTDGVYELEGNRFSTYKDDEGNILMGSLKGLSFFNPTDLDENNLEVQPQFTSISFFNSEKDRWEINTSPSFLKSAKEITLPSEYRRFSTTISVFGEANPQDIKYRYRLLSNESNSDWFNSYPGKELLYANLAAGTYTLQIEALDASNTKIGETIELRVISEDFFYKSWWFIGLLILVTIAIFSYVSYQYKVKQSLYAKNEISSNEVKMKSAMMLETHHRIKNNLQIVSGLLGLQMADSDNEELILKLQDSQSRIESIAGIHNLLYNSENLDVIGVKENVENIVAYYKSLFPTDVTYHLDIDSTILSIDEITPLSLLLNELINNSIKHAFEKTEHPEIFIEFKKNGADYLFKYHDNGSFKKREDRKESMGMNIIEMMGNQLKGELIMENNSNFKLTLVFPSAQ